MKNFKKILHSAIALFIVLSTVAGVGYAFANGFLTQDLISESLNKENALNAQLNVLELQIAELALRKDDKETKRMELAHEISLEKTAREGFLRDKLGFNTSETSPTTPTVAKKETVERFIEKNGRTYIHKNDEVYMHFTDDRNIANLVSSIHNAEGGRCASNCKSSPVGASGPMQFMPSTWNAYKCEGMNDISKLDDSICAATNYLSSLYKNEGKQNQGLEGRWIAWKSACRYNSGYTNHCRHLDTARGVQDYANKVITEMGYETT